MGGGKRAIDSILRVSYLVLRFLETSDEEGTEEQLADTDINIVCAICI